MDFEPVALREAEFLNSQGYEIYRLEDGTWVARRAAPSKKGGGLEVFGLKSREEAEAACRDHREKARVRKPTA